LFDGLVDCVCSEEFCKQAKAAHNISAMVVQIGRGQWPACFGGLDLEESVSRKHASVTAIPRECRLATVADVRILGFTFRPKISDLFASASLVVSHAGTGSIFESLRAGNPPLVVVNEDLMDNHQTEVARALQEDKHLEYCVVSDLVEKLASFDPSSLVPLPPADPHAVVAACRDEVGLVPADTIDEYKAALEENQKGRGKTATRSSASNASDSKGGSQRTHGGRRRKRKGGSK